MSDGFYLGPLHIHYYGILISFGILAATWLAVKMAKRSGLDEDYIWDMLPWVVIAGVIGARLWHIFTPTQSDVNLGLTTHYYLTHPLDAIAIWNGGLGIPGAVIGGALAAWFYSRKRKVSFPMVVDAIAPGLALAQAIGRWGNFINQELYGMPTNLPWAIYIDPQHRLAGFADVAYYHPLFLYESIANLLICGILLWMTFRLLNRKPGMVFQIYLILYPMVRFFLEFLRLDPSNVSNLNINQSIMAIIAISSASLLLWRLLHKGNNSEELISNESSLEMDAESSEGKANENLTNENHKESENIVPSETSLEENDEKDMASPQS